MSPAGEPAEVEAPTGPAPRAGGGRKALAGGRVRIERVEPGHHEEGNPRNFGGVRLIRNRSRYAVSVDGVPRGHVFFPGGFGGWWRAEAFGDVRPGTPAAQVRGRRAIPSGTLGRDGRDALAAGFVAFASDGLAPTEEEVDRAHAERSAREAAERVEAEALEAAGRRARAVAAGERAEAAKARLALAEADAARAEAARVRAAAEAECADREAVEGLIALRDRFAVSGGLSNYERAAVERAIAVLSGTAAGGLNATDATVAAATATA